MIAPSIVSSVVTVGSRREIGAGGVASRRLREAEIEHLDRAVGGNLDVRGFQITMDDPALVREVERACDLARHAERLPLRQSRALRPLARRRELVGEGGAVDELEDQKPDLLRFLESVDRADVRVIERGQRARFAFEPREPAGSLVKACGRTLMATSRPSLPSRARYTSPMPPTPISA